jgi:replicative DNA helicase
VQDCVVNGVDVVSLHHPRKTNQANPQKSLAVDDVYGSTWVTAGQGSIIALNGTPGSGVAKFRHLKHPVDEVAGFDIEIDYATGSVSAVGTRSVVDFLEAQAGGPVSTPEIIAYVEGTPDYTPARAKAIHRQLDRLVTAGAVTKHKQNGASVFWSLEDSAKDTKKDTPRDTHGHQLPVSF